MKSRIDCIKYLFREESSLYRDKLDINLGIFEKVYNELEREEVKEFRQHKTLGGKYTEMYHDWIANFNSTLEDWYYDELLESCEHEEIDINDESYFVPGPTGTGEEIEYQTKTCRFCGKEIEND